MYISLSVVGYTAVSWNCATSGKLNSNKSTPVSKVSVEKRFVKQALPNRLLSGVVDKCEGELTVTASNLEHSSFRQYTRLTYTVDEVSEAQCITSGNPTLQLFDLVAATPGNQKIFNYLCKTADVDIISLDFTHKIPFSIDKKVVSIVFYLYEYSST